MREPYKEKKHAAHLEFNNLYRKLKKMKRTDPRWNSLWSHFELAIERAGGKRENAHMIFDNLCNS